MAQTAFIESIRLSKRSRPKVHMQNTRLCLVTDIIKHT